MSVDPTVPRRGRPRSDTTRRAILDAARDRLAEVGIARLRLEDVAARAGCGKATIYRHWSTKEALAVEVLEELTRDALPIADVGDTRLELIAAVEQPMRALTETPFGAVLSGLLSEIATDPRLGEPFRATVVRHRRDQVEAVIDRGIARGDLRPGIERELATELLVGPVYFRLLFAGANYQPDFAERIVDALLHGYLAPSSAPP
jgi:AcrR family transcriptional regulator